MSLAPHSVVVAVGDELLLGTTVDTNGAWLSERLTSLGLPVQRRAVVGDSDEEIRAALEAHLGRARLVVFLGGLGPTPDDRTREVLAKTLGRNLELDEDILRALEARFRAHGIGDLPASNHRQAMVPEGGIVLHNRLGTAPGLLMNDQGTLVACLPGPPREMRGLFEDELGPFLERELADELVPVVHRTVRTTGIAESALADKMSALEGRLGDGVELAFLPGLRGVDLRLTVRGSSREAADRAIDEAERRLSPIIERFRFEAASGDLVEALAHEMSQCGDTLAVAESCTGGLLAARLTELPGASAFFLGGAVVYHNRLKKTLLGVREETLEEFGAVSEEVLIEMLHGARSRFAADGAIALTGVAGPGGGTEEKPVGTVWYGAVLGDRISTRCRRFAGNRQAVRERSAQAALARMYDFYRPAGEVR